jgi:hypothetical protein
LLRNAVAGGAIIGALAGCSSLATTPTQLQADAKALLNFATGALTTALAAAHITIPANLMGDFTTALNGVAANASELFDAIGNSATPILDRIMEGLQVVANILTPFFPAAGVAFPLFQMLISAAVALVQGWLANGHTSFAMVAPNVVIARGLVPMSMTTARQYLGG